MKQSLIVALAGVIMALSSAMAADSEEGFTTIFDGKTFTGWKTSLDNPNTWKIEDGAFVARGAVAHVFYVGDTKPFKNFELKVDVMTEPGGLYGLAHFGLTPAKDNQWWIQHIIVRGRKVTVKIDGKTVIEYNEPPVDPTGRGKKLGEGTFRTAGARSQKRHSLQEHPREAAGVVAPANSHRFATFMEGRAPAHISDAFLDGFVSAGVGISRLLSAWIYSAPV